MSRRPVDRSNMIWCISGESFWGLGMAMVGTATVVTVTLQHFGAGPLVLGLLGAIEVGGLLLPQILGPWLFNRPGLVKDRILRWHTRFILPPLLLALLALVAHGSLPNGAVILLLLVGYAGCVAGMGVLAPIWFDWFAGIFTQRQRGRVMGIGFGMAALAGAGGVSVAAWAINVLPKPLGFTSCFALAAVCGFAAVACYWRMTDGGRVITAGSVARQRQRLGFAWVSIWRLRGMRRLLIGRTCVMGTMGLVPLAVSSYQARGLSAESVVGCGMALLIASALGNVLFGYVGDRHGHRIGARIGGLMQMGAFISALLLDGIGGAILTYACVGVGAAALGVSHQNLLIESCRQRWRREHIMLCGLISGVPATIVPLGGGVLMAAWGSEGLLLSAAAISLLGAVVLPEARSLRSPSRQVVSEPLVVAYT